MNIKRQLYFLSIFISFSLNAIGENELTGSIIYNDRCNIQDHPVSHAFDNEPDTYFNSCHGGGNWIGLDLGERHIITKIAFAPRMDNDYRNRLILGVFEGANNPDFGDAIPLFVIPGSTERELTEQIIDCSRGFRYVRFVFPTLNEQGKSSYVSELKFYGYPGIGNFSRLPVTGGIPTVAIHTKNVEEITSKEDYIKGIVNIISADGKSFYSDSLDIRGRGNNSWSYPKKPYRMKLYSKASLLGFPAKEKNWTLINNFGDKTLIRNLIAFEISRRMEMPYTPAGTAVNVFLNGDFKGCYQLCDQVEVNKGRVDVEKMSVEDKLPPNVQGGYLVEIDAYANTEPSWFTSLTYRMPVTIKYPKHDEITPPQRGYIENHFNKMEGRVNAWEYKDKEEGYRRYIDTPSFLRRFLISELCGNTDSYWSVYMYKYRNDDKFYSSPIWDVELGFENDNRTYPINTRTGMRWIYKSTGSTANGARQWLNRILSDESLIDEMEEIYAYYRNKGLLSTESLQDFVDEYAGQLEESQKLNFIRWPVMNEYVHANPVIHGSYAAEILNVKNFIEERIAWMDRKLNYRPGVRIDAVSEFPVKIYSEENKLFIKNVYESYQLHIRDIAGRSIIASRQISSDCYFPLPKGVFLITLQNNKLGNHIQKVVIHK